MRVVATARGFDGITMREAGEEFDVADDSFKKRFRTIGPGGMKLDPPQEYDQPSWFKPVERKGPAAKEDKKEAKDLV